jgi:pyrimidine operon attenuation protein/uracil phosphoribosyltransferase
MAAWSTMDADQIRRAITRLGHEIVERPKVRFDASRVGR